MLSFDVVMKANYERRERSKEKLHLDVCFHTIAIINLLTKYLGTYLKMITFWIFLMIFDA